jgi:hypothetical protein
LIKTALPGKGRAISYIKPPLEGRRPKGGGVGAEVTDMLDIWEKL